MRLSILILLSAAAMSASEKAVTLTRMSILRDFAEARYNEPRFLGNGMDSCVARDYTVETGDMIYVLRQTTCHPGVIRALRVTIGQELEIAANAKNGKIGIFLSNGKFLWLDVFKQTAKR